MSENELFKDSKKESLYADLFQLLDRRFGEDVLAILHEDLADKLRAKLRAGKDLDADDLRSILAGLPPEFAAAVRAELLNSIEEKREPTKPNDDIDVVARKAVARQLLDEVDGATRGVPGATR